MSMKYYGIFTAYPPMVDLRKEGLGRHLAAFLKAAQECEDVRFIVICPSWAKQNIKDLCKSEGVPTTGFDLLAPTGRPISLSFYEAYLKFKSRPRRQGKFKNFLRKQNLKWKSYAKWHEERFITARRKRALIPSLLFVLLASLVALALSFIALPLLKLMDAARRFPSRLFMWLSALKPVRQLQSSLSLLRSPNKEAFAVRMYRQLATGETKLLVSLANSLESVTAWYSPTAFWPEFNKIEAPRLMCVPDVVLNEFPIDFALHAGERILANFEALEEAILTGDHFVTYSEKVKQETLVKNFGILPSSISTIHHAPNELSRWLGESNIEPSMRKRLSKSMLNSALSKSLNSNYSKILQNEDLKYIFYASQVRPSKNIMSLLRAYNHLLKNRHISHKLIMTGNPAAIPELKNYVEQNNLINDVIFTPGLTLPELAACYANADLAVNPSISEGGCPFTFTEALSVGTPVVMAKIPVTVEILDEEALQKSSLFDPYDWESIAERIEWALENREELLSLQSEKYADLAQRTWRDVVKEYISTLNKISGHAQNESNS